MWPLESAHVELSNETNVVFICSIINILYCGMSPESRNYLIRRDVI
jgi:hypothetical protein